ncbi:hypothetical protein AB0M39_38180 [Streptomyces sp. NPDC051907]|uniref:hypothetical protein n=1 Tax=Streptomyces sp. NPDC051907 TaxID=3155284 RepID=UPI0034457C2D
MAGVVSETLLAVRVAYNSFAFQESDDSAVPVPYNDAYVDGVFLTQHVRRFDVFSAGHTHTADVLVRVWDGEPEETNGAWDEQGEVDFESTTGEVSIWSTTHGRSPDTIVLGSLGLWRVRVGCAGRDEVRRVTQQEGVAYGVEKYAVDFWPKAE